MTPVSGDNEQRASARERDACDNRSRPRNLEGRDLSGDEPHSGKQDQQEADLGECDARLTAERKHGDRWYLLRLLGIAGDRAELTEHPDLSPRCCKGSPSPRSEALGECDALTDLEDLF
jgi:hypothetical protein